MSLIKDLQFSLRQLRKAKVFAVIAVVTLALGIGCNTAIFSVFYSVLLRPLPFPDPDRLVIVSERAANFPMLTASWLNFKDWRAQNKSFEEFGATRLVTMALTGSGQPEQIPGQMISGNLLHMLGVNTVAGQADQCRGRPACISGRRAAGLRIVAAQVWRRGECHRADHHPRSPDLHRHRGTSAEVRVAAADAGFRDCPDSVGEQTAG